MEIWKEIIGFEGYYKVSDLGRVKGIDRIDKRGAFVKERVLKQSVNSNGYMQVMLSVNCKYTVKKVHQLVAIAFLNHKTSGYKLVVNHKDFNKTNNELTNLEIVTQRQNTNKKHMASSSKYTGVSWDKERGKWYAQIVTNGKSKNLGRFVNEYDAHLAYENFLDSM